MRPLDIMASIIFSATGDDISADDARNIAIEQLLALAEADISQAMINVGFVGDHAAENFADSFRTVLGLIASPDASDD